MYRIFKKLSVLGYLAIALLLVVFLEMFVPLDGYGGMAMIRTPHRFCLNSSTLVLIFLACDAIIGTSYMVISGSLLYIGLRYKDIGLDVTWESIPRWIYVSFASFIVMCGFTHFTDVDTLWFADYWTAAVVRILCAIASVTTAAAMPEVMRSFRGKGQ